ncbi:hypothetical protein M413DRAFT_449273 [Hebeloma cylindrosporum]|uniref:Uncharacterized protein n=1 Tax=Hebeloma cylindrosporum TaxID=76867 RepID=A0A0C2XE83_HEBCY|nr:hypothetical protein M413DRAFT_449273 [Hebeloma cylindrosporum h7]
MALGDICVVVVMLINPSFRFQFMYRYHPKPLEFLFETTVVLHRFHKYITAYDSP